VFLHQQVPLVTEALCAACLLLKMASADVGADKKLDSLWSVVLDMDKQLFVSEKFLTVASDDGMYNKMGFSL
jgi:hypothetical protein